MPRSSDAHWYDSAWVERGRALQRRAALASRNSVSARARRWRSRSFFIVQCALTAAVAYSIASELFGHVQPMFAAIAAVIVLGQSFGQRLQRAAEVVAGVAVGVFTGDVFVHYAGTGPWQLALVIMVAMSAATLLDASVGMTATAGIQSAVVTILVAPPGTAFLRWTDAIIGGAVALVAATITPASPIRKPRLQASKVVSEIGAVLRDMTTALRADDIPGVDAALERARHTEELLEDLQTFSDDGLAVVRVSPFRRRHLPAVQVIADLLTPLDRCLRNLRVLVRRGAITLRTGERLPGAYLRMCDELAAVTEQMAATLEIRELPHTARVGLVEVAELTTYIDENPTLSGEVIRAQLRSMVVDLLMVTGLDYHEATSYIPRPVDLLDGTEEDDDEGDDAPGDTRS